MLGSQGEERTISSCGLFVLCMALLEEVCQCGGRLGVSYAQVMPSVTPSLLLLPVGQDVEFSAPSPALCLPACCCVSHHDNSRIHL